MTVLTVRPGSANTTLIGAIRSSNATWSVARSGGGTFTSFESAANIPGGQNTTFNINQQFLGFALGAAVPTADVSDVTFEWTTDSLNVTGGENIAILGFDAGAITSADWQDGAELAALTSYGTLTKGSYHAASTTYQLALNAAGIAASQAALRAGATFAFMMVDQNVIDNIAPVANDNYFILSEQSATAAFRPAVIITYTEPVAHTLEPADTAGATDAPISDVSIVLADATTSTDDEVLTDLTPGGDAWTLEPADAVGADDTTSAEVAVELADTAGGTDTLTNDVSTALADTAAGDDALTNDVAPALADTAGGTDTLTAVLSYVLSVADAAAPDEAWSATTTKPLADTATSSDALTREATARSIDVYLDACAGIHAIATLDGICVVEDVENDRICVYAELDE